MKKIINTYEARGTNGSTVTVYEIQDMDDAGTMENPNLQEPGSKRMELSDGRVLTMVGDREFKIAGSDEVFLLDQPYAP